MFSLPDLPYAYNTLEPYIDERTMRIHHDKHHGVYVKNLNDALFGHEALLNMDIDELVSNLEKVPEEIKKAVRNNAGGHANHSLFWTVMAAAAGQTPKGELASAIVSAFGSFDNFKGKFTQAALGRFGSGWAWLVVSNGGLEVTDTPNQDSPLTDGKTPILGLDVWEHAYYLKYQNRRADYVQAWWNVVNWSEVERRFGQAK